MKRHLGTFIGGMTAGALSFGVWPEMWKSYGIMGGFLTAVFVIGITWFMNHWIGVIENPDGKLWVDQGLPIFGAGVAWGVVRFWPVDGGLDYALGALAKVWPTLVCCLIGGALAGLAAHFVKQVAPGWKPAEEEQK